MPGALLCHQVIKSIIIGDRQAFITHERSEK
jgi:hypothetical protein